MTSNHWRLRATRSVFIAFAATVFVAVSVVMPTALGRVGEVDQERALRRAQAAELVDQARAELTFDLLMPEWLPDGYILEHIAWFPPDENLGYSSSSVDAWYGAPGRPFIHVWQTDNPDLGKKDPVLVGGLLDMASESAWYAARGLRGLDTDSATALSTRLPDDVTVSIDSGIPIDDLIKVAESLTATPPK